MGKKLQATVDENTGYLVFEFSSDEEQKEEAKARLAQWVAEGEGREASGDAT